MQYVGRAIGSVSKTWNSINPATLSGAIDVIVVEQENGDLACSPFHIRFGKFSLLQPSQKKVDFSVNGQKMDFAMKLGDGGEAFFVFETDSDVPSHLLTSPVLSPSSSAASSPASVNSSTLNLQEPEFLDLEAESNNRLTSDASSDSKIRTNNLSSAPQPKKAVTSPIELSITPDSISSDAETIDTTTGTGHKEISSRRRSSSTSNWPSIELSRALLSSLKSDDPESSSAVSLTQGSTPVLRPRSPPLSRDQAIQRAKELSRKLSISRIPTTVTDNGDLVLDMRGYKAGEEETARAESIARQILSEELAINTEIASLIAPDEHGNLWIYATEEARDKAAQRHGSMQFDYDIDDNASEPPPPPPPLESSLLKSQSVQLGTPPFTPPPAGNESETADDSVRNYVKTLRLTSDQLKSLNLVPGANQVSFSVNGGRAVCTSRMFYWRYDLPIVISDIDGTITKSDALGHVLTMLGRDWTHVGVAKLFTDITNNGYNIMYLTSRSVGQADTTRHYLKGIEQGSFKLPDGPVILSPDRTIAALRREVIYRKPEVFKMACLRDIQSLFGLRESTPFYAGFGNRITDALSYRSVGVPSSRIFTINSSADVHMELLELAGYKSSYVHMTDLVDHFFPPVSTQLGDERYTDTNFWREPVLEIEDSDEEEDQDAAAASETATTTTLATTSSSSTATTTTSAGAMSTSASSMATRSTPPSILDDDDDDDDDDYGDEDDDHDFSEDDEEIDDDDVLEDEINDDDDEESEGKDQDQEDYDDEDDDDEDELPDELLDEEGKLKVLANESG
ncbi:Lipin/Ned1/Smp2-domain-containing protein [Lipomyces japonicus]|uniref:Lipin/Ned1/Smp2-domain-containing protein n=1 Tax=Lipomyces japonicus TaxID=56871 RepID=UPI0034CD8B65